MMTDSRVLCEEFADRKLELHKYIFAV